MTTIGHYTGFWVKDAIATMACACCIGMSVSACNDSTNPQASTPSPPATSAQSSAATTEGFTLNSLINSLEGAKTGVKDAVVPHADAVQARTKEEVEKLFRWEYKVVESSASNDATTFQQLLSQLGEDGWECFHIDRPAPETTRTTCKRRPKSAISYLKYIPGL